MNETSTVPKLLNIKRVVERAHGYGLESVTENTVRRAAYKTLTLERPKVKAGVAYWTPEQIDAWLMDL